VTPTVERTSIDMDAIRKAADSPDANVRRLAMRRLEIERELSALDVFLSFYVAEAAKLPVVQLKQTVKQHTNGASVPLKGKTEAMLTACRNILVAHGQPMRIGELYAAMKEKDPTFSLANTDSMRARLSSHKDKLIHIDGRGFWPTGVEMPRALDS
jgi:hypothetical protein